MSYTPPKAAPNALRLHCNEGATPPAPWQVARQYPDTSALRAAIARRLNRPEPEVLVTAGADGAIDRVMRAFAGPGQRVVVLDPTFEMIANYAMQAGADVVRIAWDDDFPLETVIDIGRNSAVVALVTPDNPTGRTIGWDQVVRIASELPQTVILLDQAYVEYADEDYTARAAAVPNIVVTRTFSKAWGLAGLRVGYAVASPDFIRMLGAVGSPYPVSSISLEAAAQCIETPSYVDEHVARVRVETGLLATLLDELGARAVPSEANFVFARFDDAGFVADGLTALGIAVRRFDRPGLRDALRIGCPASTQDFARLESALRQVMRPDALLFDMDGVLADVSRSYRAAIQETCRAFGVEVSDVQISASKRLPNSNDDFVVSQRLLAEGGVERPISEVAAEFQRRYDAGLWQAEKLLLSAESLRDLGARFSLGVVTGRPRPDAERFLSTHGIAELFGVVICREDAELKPSPEPVEVAMRRLEARTAWMFGDTTDDLAAARGAGVLPIGITAPGENNATTNETLRNAGAAQVFANIREALECL